MLLQLQSPLELVEQQTLAKLSEAPELELLLGLELLVNSLVVAEELMEDLVPKWQLVMPLEHFELMAEQQAWHELLLSAFQR